MKANRYETGALGIHPRQPSRTRWRSGDLKGPLPARVAQGLASALQSIPRRGPWPELDEEAWWNDVLADRRLRPSTDKRLSDRDSDARLRLDRLPCKTLTFSCKQCRRRTSLTVAELMRTFGADRNVGTIGREVIECGDKRARREGYECPIIYSA